MAGLDLIDTFASIPLAYRWAATLLFVAVLAALSTTAGTGRRSGDVFGWLYDVTPAPAQKTFHVVSYAILALLLMWALSTIASFGQRAVLVAALSLGLGIALEWYQTRVPGRFGTVSGVLLDALGVAIGIGAAAAVLMT